MLFDNILSDNMMLSYEGFSGNNLLQDNILFFGKKIHASDDFKFN
jgi:hypothetical protein